MFFLYHKTSYKTGRAIAKALGFQHFGKVPKGKFDLVLRWGNATPLPGVREIQPAQAILRASDKLAAFRAMHGEGLSIPGFTDSRSEAQELLDAGHTVFGRTRRGFRARGITIYQPGDSIGSHELYTRYIPNRREYRLHVVGESVIRTQRKYTNAGNEDAFIKNHAAGFIFNAPRNELKADRTELAVGAVKALGLDLGAVDMVIDANGIAYVLEINTAPACSPLTATAYVNALSSLITDRSDGDYEPNVSFTHLEKLRPEGEEIDRRAEVLAYA